MNKITIFILLMFCTVSFAESTEKFYQLLSKQHAVGAGIDGYASSTPLGAYAINTNGNPYDPDSSYDPNEGTYEFWTMTYGDQHIRKFSFGVDGASWDSHYDGYAWTTFTDGYGSHVDSDMSEPGINNIVGTSIVYANSLMLGRVASAAPDFSTGDCSNLRGGTITTGSFVLNPAPLTFNGVDYQAGQLALLTAISGTSDPYYRKVVLLYDLRKISEYTDKQPDYNTGEDGRGNQTPVYGAYNQVDWNDCFYPLVTGADILATIPEATTVGRTFNFGRQAVWAPDSSAIYFAGFCANENYNESNPESAKYWNGIWKYDMASGQLEWIKREYTRESRMFYSEMAVVDTEVRDFTNGAESGLQILYSSETENVGGISCVVDNGQVNSNVYTVVDVNEFANLIGVEPGVCDARNIVTSEDGEIYFYCLGSSIASVNGVSLVRGPYAIYCYDRLSRYYAVSNRAMHMNFHYAKGSGISGSTGAMNRFQYYNNLFGKKMLTFQSTPLKAPCGVEIFEPIDFNFDGEVSMADLEIFRDQRIANDNYIDPNASGTGGDEVLPSILDAPADYIACDIDGNSNYYSVLIYGDSGKRVSDEILETLDYSDLDPNMNYEVVTNKLYFNEKIVTENDAEILYQFIPAGDADLNGSVNLADFALLSGSYISGDSEDDRRNYGEGDFDFDGDVDLADFILMAGNWLFTIPEYPQ